MCIYKILIYNDHNISRIESYYKIKSTKIRCRDLGRGSGVSKLGNIPV